MKQPLITAHTTYRFDAAKHLDAAIKEVRLANYFLEMCGELDVPLVEPMLIDAFNILMKERV